MLSRYTQWREAKSSHAIRNRFKVALVEKIPLFEGFSTRELNQIARLVNEFEVPAGTRLATIGEPGREMFVIVEGEASVTARPERTTLLKPGDCFGEMSLLDGEPRSATVEATTPLRLLVLAQREFQQLLDETASLARKIMRTLCQRLREAEKYAPDTKRASFGS